MRQLNDLISTAEPAPERKAMCLYRVQDRNKDWLIAEGGRRGYRNTAEFLDAILDQLRKKSGTVKNDKKKKVSRASKKAKPKRKLRS